MMANDKPMRFVRINLTFVAAAVTRALLDRLTANAGRQSSR